MAAVYCLTLTMSLHVHTIRVACRTWEIVQDCRAADTPWLLYALPRRRRQSPLCANVSHPQRRHIITRDNHASPSVIRCTSVFRIPSRTSDVSTPKVSGIQWPRNGSSVYSGHRTGWSHVHDSGGRRQAETLPVTSSIDYNGSFQVDHAVSPTDVIEAWGPGCTTTSIALDLRARLLFYVRR